MLLVTGGAGFIGSNLVAALCDRGERVAVCDRLGQDEKWRNLARRDLAALIDPDDLADWLRDQSGRVRALFHMGAISATTERDADALAETNVRLPQRLWRWCAEAGVPMIYASSAATYGDGGAGFDDDLAGRCQAGLLPLNGYGWSKLLFDRWVVRELAGERPRPPAWAGLRFFNVYGPNEYHKGGQASVAWHLFQQVAGGEPATLFRSHRPDHADGEQRRDFVWVGDCVAVMLWLFEHPEASGLFNVGTGEARSFADLARALFAAVGQPENIRYVPTPEAIRDKYQYFTQARLDRLRAAGYAGAFTSLEEGVRRYVTDYLAAADPYR